MKKLLNKLNVNLCFTGIAMLIGYLIIFILSFFIPFLEMDWQTILYVSIGIFTGIFTIDSIDDCYKYCIKEKKEE